MTFCPGTAPRASDRPAVGGDAGAYRGLRTALGGWLRIRMRARLAHSGCQDLDAEEAVQEAMVRVVQTRAERLEPPYFYAAVRNAALNVKARAEVLRPDVGIVDAGLGTRSR